jgi:hypothetical protein
MLNNEQNVQKCDPSLRSGQASQTIVEVMQPGKIIPSSMPNLTNNSNTQSHPALACEAKKSNNPRSAEQGFPKPTYQRKN